MAGEQLDLFNRSCYTPVQNRKSYFNYHCLQAILRSFRPFLHTMSTYREWGYSRYTLDATLRVISENSGFYAKTRNRSCIRLIFSNGIAELKT